METILVTADASENGHETGKKTIPRLLQSGHETCSMWKPGKRFANHVYVRFMQSKPTIQ